MQVGPPGEVVDYRHSYVNTTNDRHARFYCVRMTHNGEQIRQLCDPTDNLRTNDGEMTGVVRAAVEQFWGDLRRGHFLDSLTRVLTITLQLKSNHVGVAYRLTLMLELTSLGTVLPSYAASRLASAAPLAQPLATRPLPPLRAPCRACAHAATTSRRACSRRKSLRT